MITPAGTECRFYYEDFARGAARQECRIPKSSDSAPWRPSDCARCAVPRVLAANSSPDLELRLTIKPGLLGLGRRLHVKAWCGQHGPVITDPCVGCPVCNVEADELLHRAFDE